MATEAWSRAANTAGTNQLYPHFKASDQFGQADFLTPGPISRLHDRVP
jgi:hypothetical protein